LLAELADNVEVVVADRIFDDMDEAVGLESVA